MNPLQFAKLVPLLSKTLEQLTNDDLSLVTSTFGIEVSVTNELRVAGLALLKGQNINSVADAISKPESVQQLLSLFQKKRVEPDAQAFVNQCPHCGLFQTISLA